MKSYILKYKILKMYEIVCILLILTGIKLPIFKIPIFIYFVSFRKPCNYEFLEPNKISSYILKNYSPIHFAITFGLTFFIKVSPKKYFFTPFDFVYNFLIYGTILTDIFGKNIFTCLLASFFQNIDNTPFLMALLDNYVLLYCNRINFLFIKSTLCLFNYVISIMIL